MSAVVEDLPGQAGRQAQAREAVRRGLDDQQVDGAVVVHVDEQARRLGEVPSQGGHLAGGAGGRVGAGRGVAADGDIELAAGDWQLVVYTQGNGTNLLISSTLREIWEEQIRVDGEGGDVPDPVDEGCPFDITVNVDGVFVETITDVDPCVDNTLTLNITYS